MHSHDLFPSLVWRKSSYSGGVNNCVEIADLPASVAVRDSKHPTRTKLDFDNSAWASFVRCVKEDGRV